MTSATPIPPAWPSCARTSVTIYERRARCVAHPEQIVITAGTQHAIDVAIRVLLAPGDEVWVEDPGYPLTHAQLLLCGCIRFLSMPRVWSSTPECAWRLGRAWRSSRPRISFRPASRCRWRGAWSCWRGRG